MLSRSDGVTHVFVSMVPRVHVARRALLQPTAAAVAASELQHDDPGCWAGFTRTFKA